ncbi:hypothetical protein C0W42_11605 [Photobacterium kishitanii]|nr:hypothetical protein C0W42_11605 [Photobacterium kishitanii]
MLRSNFNHMDKGEYVWNCSRIFFPIKLFIEEKLNKYVAFYCKEISKVCFFEELLWRYFNVMNFMSESVITNKILKIEKWKSFLLSCLLFGVIIFLIILTIFIILIKIKKTIIMTLIGPFFTRN